MEWFAIKRITANRDWWVEQSADDRLIRSLVLRLSIPPLVLFCSLAVVLGLVTGSRRSVASALVCAALGIGFLLVTTASKSGVARCRRRVVALLGRSG